MAELYFSFEIPLLKNCGEVLGDAGSSYFVAAEGRFCVGDADDSR